MLSFTNNRRAIKDLQGRIVALEADKDDLEESYSYVLQAKGEAENAMKAMQRPMSPEGLQAIADGLEADIADIYARGGLAVDQRQRVIADKIKSVINLCLTGVR